MCFLRRNSHILDLTENLHKFGANIGGIVYLPTLDPNSPTLELFKFMDLLEPNNVDSLNQQLEGFKQSYLRYKGCAVEDRNNFAFEFILDLHCTSEAAFLVEVKTTQDVEQVKFDARNNLIGYEGGWDTSSSTWIFAENMESALKQGIILGKENLINIKECCSVGG